MIDKNKMAFPEFLNDAFVEIEDHLIKIRKNILVLEEAFNKGKTNFTCINDLIISFHTLKGISGMLGIKETQSLAHEIENYLRALKNKEVKLRKESIDTFVQGVKLFEQIISANKSSQIENLEINITSLNNIIETITNLGKPIQEEEKFSSEKINLASKFPFINEESLEIINEGLSKGETLFEIHFHPTQELFNKGINVNTIKKTLSEIGNIIHAAPKRDELGDIYFEFLFMTSNPIEHLNSLSEMKLIINEVEELTNEKSEEKIEISTTQIESQESETSIQQINTSNFVRVELSKLDELMRMVGDLVISRARLDSNLKLYQREIPTHVNRILNEINLGIEKQLRDLREGIMRTRLVPIGEVFDKMQFVVRELIRESKKSIDLQITGKETEIDKYVVEKIFDPILHLVRNSVSHGIESPDERQNWGKSPTGKISLKAYTSGDSVIIEIEDDGKGINKAAVFKKAEELKLAYSVSQNENETLLNIICQPGFSTRTDADLVSGRGYGMAIVRNSIQELGGTIEFETKDNLGTKFIIHIPLTLAIVDALIVSINGQSFAIPQPTIHEVIELDETKMKKLENNQIIPYRDRILPIIYLSKLFHLNKETGKTKNVIVVGNEKNLVGLIVDKIKASREIVVQTFTDPFIHTLGISGATELGDGKAVLILDPNTIIKEVNNLVMN